MGEAPVGLELVGREAEMDAIEGVLERAKGGFAALAVDGEIGIGKTTLLESARSRADELGWRVLGASPVPADIPFGFAGLGDLFDSVPDERLDALPRPQRRALAAALLRDEAVRLPDAGRAVAAGTLSVLRGLAAEGPVLVVIDDLPSLDPASATVLSSVLRRLTREPVAVLSSARATRQGLALPALDGVSPTRLERLTLGPLPTADIARVLAARGLAVERRLGALAEQVAAGNPFLALELARASAARVGWPPHEPVVPPTLRRLVERRLDPLPAPVKEMLLLVALADRQPATTLIGQAADPRAARTAIDTGLDAALLRVNDGHLEVAHPLVRTVLVASSPAAARRAAHRRLAEITTNLEARARHRGLSADGPDETVADELDAAARSAADRGAKDEAARLADLAVELSVPDDPAPRCERQLWASVHWFNAGDLRRAATHADDAAAHATDGPQRARALIQAAKVRRYGGAPTAEWERLLMAALAEAGDDAPTRGAVSRDLGLAASQLGHVDTALRWAQASLRDADRVGDRALAAEAAAGVAYLRAVHGDGLPAELVARALDHPDADASTPAELRPRYALAMGAYGTDDNDLARGLLHDERRWAVAHADEAGLAVILWLAAIVEADAGSLATGRALADQAVEAAEASGSGGPAAPLALALAARSHVAALEGDTQRCRADSAKAAEIGTDVGVVYAVVYALQARGLLELSVGESAAAVTALAPLCERLDLTSVEPGFARFVPDAAEGLVLSGSLAEAEALLGPYAERARAVGRRSAIAASARCDALVRAARGDLGGAAGAIDQALAAHAGADRPLDLARTRLVAGSILRRARRKADARDHLAAAAQAFGQAGARQWAARAADELSRVGLRRPGPAGRAGVAEDLTEVEKRVADLVAAGRTNREVASELFMSLRTVEAHLTRVYRKLGVRSRTELAAARATSPAPSL